MANERMICVGEIIAAHGIAGEVKVKSFTEIPLALAKLSPLWDEKLAREFELTLRSQNEAVLIVSLKGISRRDEAEKLRGTKLYALREKLPKLKPRQFYFSDLKGLRAVDGAGAEIGLISDVMNFGAGDIIAVLAGTKEYLLPFKEPFARDPDLDAGTITVEIPADFPFSEKKPKKKRKARPRKTKPVMPADAGIHGDPLSGDKHRAMDPGMRRDDKKNS